VKGNTRYCYRITLTGTGTVLKYSTLAASATEADRAAKAVAEREIRKSGGSRAVIERDPFVGPR
jgi:hypothetical protein